MNGHLWAGLVNHTIVAHSTYKWNCIPVPKYSIAYLVPGSITYAFEIVCLIAHTTYYTGIAQKINEFGDTTFDDRKWDLCIL